MMKTTKSLLKSARGLAQSIAVCALMVGCLAVQGWTVTGLVERVNFTASTKVITIAPVSSPLVNGAGTSFQSETITVTPTAGRWSHELEAGFYNVTFGTARDVYRIEVPSGSGTNNFWELATNSVVLTTNIGGPFVTYPALNTTTQAIWAAIGSGGGGGGGSGDVTTAQLLSASNSLRSTFVGNDTTTSNALRSTLIANDTTTSNGVVTLLVANDTTTSNSLRSAFIANDTTTSNGVVTLLVANDTVTSNGVVTLLVANDTTTSNSLRSAFIANDTTTSNGIVALHGPQIAGLTNNLNSASNYLQGQIDGIVGGGGFGDVTTAQLNTASNFLRTTFIANDTTTSNGVVTLLVANDTVTSNSLRSAFIANDTTTSNGVVTLLVANDTTTSNALRSASIANDTTTSNGVVTLLVANDTTTSNALRSAFAAADITTSNGVVAFSMAMSNTLRSLGWITTNDVNAMLSNGVPFAAFDSIVFGQLTASNSLTVVGPQTNGSYLVLTNLPGTGTNLTIDAAGNVMRASLPAGGGGGSASTNNATMANGSETLGDAYLTNSIWLQRNTLAYSGVSNIVYDIATCSLGVLNVTGATQIRITNSNPSVTWGFQDKKLNIVQYQTNAAPLLVSFQTNHVVTNTPLWVDTNAGSITVVRIESTDNPTNYWLSTKTNALPRYQTATASGGGGGGTWTTNFVETFDTGSGFDLSGWTHPEGANNPDFTAPAGMSGEAYRVVADGRYELRSFSGDFTNYVVFKWRFEAAAVVGNAASISAIYDASGVEICAVVIRNPDGAGGSANRSLGIRDSGGTITWMSDDITADSTIYILYQYWAGDHVSVAYSTTTTFPTSGTTAFATRSQPASSQVGKITILGSGGFIMDDLTVYH